MDEILVVEEADFQGSPMVNGGFRRASTELFDQHQAQVTIVDHPAGAVVATHVHTVDEVFYLLEGSLRLGKDNLSAGSVLFIGGDTPYGFTVGSKGVKWLMVRPNRAALDHAEGTDYKEIEGDEAGGARGQILPAAEIEALPWQAAGDGLRQRTLIAMPGYPRVAMVEAAPGDHRPQSASARRQFLCVIAGSLQVAGRRVGRATVVSVPAGCPYTPVAVDGPATYLMIEAADAGG